MNSHRRQIVVPVFFLIFSFWWFQAPKVNEVTSLIFASLVLRELSFIIPYSFYFVF